MLMNPRVALRSSYSVTMQTPPTHWPRTPIRRWCSGSLPSLRKNWKSPMRCNQLARACNTSEEQPSSGFWPRTQRPTHLASVLRRQWRFAHCRSFGPGEPALVSCEPELGLFHQSRDPHQNHRANKRDDDRAKNASTWPNAEHPKHPAADDAAESAQDDVNDHAVSAAPHYFSGEPAGDQPNHNPVEQSHVRLSPCEYSSPAGRPFLEPD